MAKAKAPTQPQAKPKPERKPEPKPEPSEKVVHSEAKSRVDKPPAPAGDGKPVGKDTPSALAVEKAKGDAEVYQAEKKKHRWG